MSYLQAKLQYLVLLAYLSIEAPTKYFRDFHFFSEDCSCLFSYW